MTKNDTVWQTAELTQTYLNGVRGAIPLARQQIDVILHLIRAACPAPTLVLDLGCGDGILGQAVLDQHPAAHALFLDFSPPMLDAARQRLKSYPNAHFVLVDYGRFGWEEKLLEIGDWRLEITPQREPIVNRKSKIVNLFEIIVSGFSIHHQPDERKREIYAEIFRLLKPGGIFLNLEHVASPTPWLEKRFEEHFLDSLFAYHQQQGSGKTREQLDQEFYSRPDKAANILAPVETQCAWLRQLGFQQVDCYLKIYELALFGGIKRGYTENAE